MPSKLKQYARHLKRRWQQLERKWRRGLSLLLVLILVGFTARSLPYLAPIRATDIAQQDRAITFTDRRGLPLGTLLTGDREQTAIVPLDRISPHFRHAIIAAEDKRFYQHGGLDLQAIARSLLEALQAREIVSGASTITMQLARMLHPAERTLPNKLREIWRSWRLEAGMSKDEILHAYINRLPMGGNIYGVEAASRLYFGTPAADLDIARASLLAAIPNAPNRLNPYWNWQQLQRRQQYVLDRMVEDGYISPTQAQLAAAETPQLQPRDRDALAAPHFLFWLADRLPEGVSRVRTTLDLPLQRFVEGQVRQVVRALAPKNANHAAALVIDNQTGEVLAYVGSPNYFADAHQGRNDGVQALRQPGSTLKPFLYELALERGAIAPNSILADVPTHYAIPNAQIYSPTDYSETFLGPVPVRLALGNSLNVPAVRVLETIQVAPFLDRLRQLGFEHLTRSPDYYGLGLALGSGEVSLWELARAYVQMANRGTAKPLVAAFDYDIANPNHSIEDNWFPLIVDMLDDDGARAAAFGVDSVLNLPFPVAVKTGTSSDYRDTWTVGFTRDYTVATWVGNFSGDRMIRVSGVTGAAPLWQRIMLHLHRDRPPEAFAAPADLVRRPICTATGLKPTDTCNSVIVEYLAPEDLQGYNRPESFEIPAAYDEWLARQERSPFAESGLRIGFPQENDYFLIGDKNNAPTVQFKLATPPQHPVTWSIAGGEGKRVLETSTADAVSWQMQPGTWTLEVEGKQQRDRVRFQVEVADPRSPKRGFSVRSRS